MPRPRSALARFNSVLRSRAPVAKKAAIVTRLASSLPDAAFRVMDEAMDTAEPLVQVAIMDAYFEMTGDDYHEQDLERILDAARLKGDDGEELYMAARLALGRINGRAGDALGEWGDGALQVIGIRTRARAVPRGKRGRRAARRRVRRPRQRERITLIIHGTWAGDGKWWRPGGDFFRYVKTDLGRLDLYGARDQFRWSGKNRDFSRKKAAVSLDDWLRSHPSAEINVFAHSHGANVAMLATHRGIRIDRLVMLSPPVRGDYFARWSNVGAAYNIQADHDPVVAIARGGKWFRLARVREKELRANGHSASHDPDVWRREGLARFIGIPWRP